MIYDRRKDTEVTESNLHWLAFWLEAWWISPVSLWFVSLSAVIYMIKKTPCSLPECIYCWSRPGCCYLAVRCWKMKLSLDGLLLDSMTGLLCTDHFLRTALCSNVLYSVWKTTKMMDYCCTANVQRVQICWLSFVPPSGPHLQHRHLPAPFLIINLYYLLLFAVCGLQIRNCEQVSSPSSS